MSKVMVTGVNGFVGKHLVRELLQQKCEVIGVGREPELHPELKEIVTNYFVCDLTDKRSVSNLPLKGIDAVISLAGLAQVGASFTNPEKYNQINVAVLSVIGKELLEQGLSPRVIAISTGAVYESNQSLPLTETSQLIKNGSPYALSKIRMEEEASKLRENGLQCVVVRPFNHIGPGQEPGFLVPDLAAKILEAKVSGKPVLVGNLKTKRDYTDVRDVVKAYALLAQTGALKNKLYNVCSGKSIAGEMVLETLLEASGTQGKVTVEQDPELIRPNDPPDLYGSHDLLTEDTGWQPTIPFERTIQDFVASKQL